jgi:diguanylate cyclase (GGDEF)-like protein
MEYPSQYDFFLRFKALFNDEDKFMDYVLVDVSDNFQKAAGIKSELLLGKRISEIAEEDLSDAFGMKEIYYNMIPKTRRKYEKHIEELDRWYLINLFSDDKDYLILFYNDISRFKKPTESPTDPMRNSRGLYNLKGKGSCFGYKDRLTGLYNRDFFEEEFSRLDSQRQLPLSVIMGDLSGLKLINDAFGHDMGDKALRKVADLMKNAFRKEDIISRVGGDEFVILLPQTTEKTALSIIKRIKDDCIANPLDYIKISVSFGAATKTKDEEDISEVYRKAEDRMYFSKLKESKEAKLSVIKYLKDKLEEISFETEAHYERLKSLCLMLADKLDMSDIEKEELKLLCEFHDIGKIGIPPKILQKKDTLSNDEWERVRRHSEIGYHIIGSSKETLAIDELILVHHERWDGKGYPGLLKNEGIPLTARIFVIADAYEAMVNDRPYKDKVNNAEALKEIESKAGSQFDPYLAKIFVQIMSKEKAAV